jgi:hypothetical protein
MLLDVSRTAGLVKDFVSVNESDPLGVCCATVEVFVLFLFFPPGTAPYTLI